ncbi:MAG: hypothetical protein U9R37_03915 [Campylobacterota bacterium]|nr:hypothetical protein [Campylobacterota bacterium]
MKEKSFDINNFIPSKTLFSILILVLLAITGYISQYIYDNQTKEFTEKLYQKENDKIITSIKDMYNQKLNNISLVSSALSENDILKNSMINYNPDILNLERLIDSIKTKKDYVDTQVEIIDSKGYSFKRSWETITDEKVKVKKELDFLYPKMNTKIETNQYGTTLVNNLPLYYDNAFYGYFSTFWQLDDMVSLLQKDGYKAISILNKDDSNLVVQNVSFSKRFIDDRYIVNSNVDSYLMRLVSQIKKELILNNWENDYYIDIGSDHLISKYEIYDDNKNVKVTFFIFKNLVELNYTELENIQKIHIVLTVFTMIFIVFFINYIYVLSKVSKLDKINRRLLVTNEDLNSKTDEMDYKDKKLENLFNMQPNLMFMHNGKEITQANKRFMGFFNRFETFDGFRQNHHCVCELFEPCDAPNYISEQYIEGTYWIDYILQNPKRFYKVIIPYKDSKIDSPHHFIIKVNEMNYAKLVHERLIVIALVDVTQDLVNYKNLC